MGWLQASQDAPGADHAWDHVATAVGPRPAQCYGLTSQTYTTITLQSCRKRVLTTKKQPEFLNLHGNTWKIKVIVQSFWTPLTKTWQKRHRTMGSTNVIMHIKILHVAHNLLRTFISNKEKCWLCLPCFAVVLFWLSSFGLKKNVYVLSVWCCSLHIYYQHSFRYKPTFSETQHQKPDSLA